MPVLQYKQVYLGEILQILQFLQKKARMMVVAQLEHDMFAVYALGFRSHAYYHRKTWQTMQVIVKISLQNFFQATQIYSCEAC